MTAKHNGLMITASRVEQEMCSDKTMHSSEGMKVRLLISPLYETPAKLVRNALLWILRQGEQICIYRSSVGKSGGRWEGPNPSNRPGAGGRQY